MMDPNSIVQVAARNKPAVTDPRRYEIKMICEEEAHDFLIARLLACSGAVHRRYPQRRVQSIYFDTDSGFSLAENLGGTSNREKLRFRWYGSDTGSVTGQLERKVRTNMLGVKRVHACARRIDVENVVKPLFVRTLRSIIPAEWQSCLDEKPEPVQWIVYNRDYFEAFAGRVRITLDRDLVAHNQRERAALSSRFPTPVPECTIVEFKAAEQDYELVETMVQEFPVAADRCSKFVIASDPHAAPTVSRFLK